MHACTHTRACKRSDTRARTEEEIALEGYPQRRPAGVKGTIIILAGRCKLEMEKDIKESQLNPRGSTVRTTCCSAVQHVATAQQVLCRCCNTARHVATRHGMLRHGTACCNTARHVATRHGMLQHGKELLLGGRARIGSNRPSIDPFLHRETSARSAQTAQCTATTVGAPVGRRGRVPGRCGSGGMRLPVVWSIL